MPQVAVAFLEPSQMGLLKRVHATWAAIGSGLAIFCHTCDLMPLAVDLATGSWACVIVSGKGR